MTDSCKVCWDSDCEVTVPAGEVNLVLSALRDQYGRSLEHIAPLRQFAAEIVHDLTRAGRLGDGEAREDGWTPDARDVDEFGGPLANSHGVMRLWRAEEIGTVALLALGRAGRLLARARKSTPATRERWLAELTRLASEVGGVSQRWQLDLAARVLSDQPEVSIVGGTTVWCFGQTRAGELLEDMKAAGRLNEWGNFPSAAGEPLAGGAEP